MESLFLLIPLSLLLVGLAIWVFLRMSDSGQFDDMDGPAHSVLMDDDRPRGAKGQPPEAPQPPQPPQPPSPAPNPANAQAPQKAPPRASVPRNE
jgi:cbb3-type cytochrome oxidase maturation protein